MAINKKLAIVVVTIITTSVYIKLLRPYESESYQPPIFVEEENLMQRYVGNDTTNWRGLTKKQEHSLSTLGRILYLDEEIPPERASKKFKILIWKYGPAIEKRHIYHFSKTKHDPFEKCSARNCHLTYKDEDLSSADIVIIHLHRTKGLKDLPPKSHRKEEQIWAFLTDESPYHTFLSSKDKLSAFNGIFNWSMTYRMDSDIPVPYGRTVPLKYPSDIDLNKEYYSWKKKKRRDVLVAIMGSNCGSRNKRWEYVRELKKYMTVDAYGGCGTLKCPGHFSNDCPVLGDYMFYLSFENSNCDEYLTEKVWWNAYHKNSIPIVMGASKTSYKKLLPPHSFINVEDFASPRDLANYLIYLNGTSADLFKYFQWKRYFKILNEHGYFKSPSFHYCRVCEALNYNSRETKVYNDLESFWSTKNCYPGWM